MFDGSENATRAKKLEEHQRLRVSCQLKPETEIVKEGISDLQWENLTKQANKKSKGSSCPLPKNTVEKWNEIWAVLFPDLQGPPNPCKLILLLHGVLLTVKGHPREEPQSQSLVPGDSPVGSFQKLFEAALHQKVKTGEISMNDVTISRVVDVARQTFVFSLSRGIQDLNLGTSSGLQHSSDYGSLLGGSYLEVQPSSTGTVIQNQHANQRSNLDIGSQRAPQTDISSGTHTNSAPVSTADQMYPQGIDHNVMTSPNTGSGAIDQFGAFHADTLMQRTLSGQYMQTFASTSSFDNGYPLGGDASYPMPSDTFYQPDVNSCRPGNQNNASHVLYQSPASIQPSNTAQFRNPGEFCHPPHDLRR